MGTLYALMLGHTLCRFCCYRRSQHATCNLKSHCMNALYSDLLTLARAHDALLLKLAPEQSLPLLQKHIQQKLAACGASLSLAEGLLLSIEEVTDAPLTMWVDRTCGSVSPDMSLLRLHMRVYGVLQHRWLQHLRSILACL